jgi:hypothetical protein
VASQNFKLRLDNLAAENHSLLRLSAIKWHQLNLESPRGDDGDGSDRTFSAEERNVAPRIGFCGYEAFLHRYIVTREKLEGLSIPLQNELLSAQIETLCTYYLQRSARHLSPRREMTRRESYDRWREFGIIMLNVVVRVQLCCSTLFT